MSDKQTPPSSGPLQSSRLRPSVHMRYNSSTKLTAPGDGDKYFHKLAYVGVNRSVGRCPMATLARNLTSVGNPLNWTLLFARQPEPDLEFTEEELDQTTTLRSIGPLKPRKKPSGGR